MTDDREPNIPAHSETGPPFPTRFPTGFQVPTQISTGPQQQPHREAETQSLSEQHPDDARTPHLAGIREAVLNAATEFDMDHATRELLRPRPEAVMLARDNREWLRRVVHYLAHTIGIDQFLDCGSGLPTSGNTHEVARNSNPSARVVYVDNDPVMLAYGEALLRDDPNTRFVAADIRRPQRLLSNPDVTTHLDLGKPIGLLHVGILHHVSDEDSPRAILGGYLDALASGSYVAISHFHNPDDDSDVARTAQKAEDMLLGDELGSGKFRSAAEIARLFHELDLVEPGIVAPADWRPETPHTRPLDVPRQLMLAGLAHKP